MTRYKQLSYDKRTKLAILKNEGVSVKKIAKTLGRARSTIYNALKTTLNVGSL